MKEDRLFKTETDLEKFLSQLNGYHPKQLENGAASSKTVSQAVVLARSGSPLHAMPNDSAKTADILQGLSTELSKTA